jgi:RNA polymerase sigma-70 factor (ECF subfamily)
VPALNPPDEKDLIQRAQQGNAEAFADLYRRYAPLVFRYFFFRTNDRAAAEDLTAEVFLRLVKSLSEYRDRGLPFAAWVFRIAHARVVDYHRYHARRPSETLSEQTLDPRLDPEALAAHRWEITRLAGAIGRLTDEQQSVVQFRFVEGYSLEETARLMQKSVGAVKALQHRALLNLTRKIDHAA